MIYHVVAMAQNRVIGRDNKLPWHFPEDLKHFKALTSGQTVLMGRKTYESIGKPLPNRENFVLSRTKKMPQERLYFFSNLEDALGEIKTEHCFIIGGAQIYESTMDVIDGIYLTQIDGIYEGDAYYPEIPYFFQLADQKILQKNPKLEVYFYARQDAA